MAQNDGWYAGQNAEAQNGEDAKNQAGSGLSIGLRLLPVDRSGIRLLRRILGLRRILSLGRRIQPG